MNKTVNHYRHQYIPMPKEYFDTMVYPVRDFFCGKCKRCGSVNADSFDPVQIYKFCRVCGAVVFYPKSGPLDHERFWS